MKTMTEMTDERMRVGAWSKVCGSLLSSVGKFFCEDAWDFPTEAAD